MAKGAKSGPGPEAKLRRPTWLWLAVFAGPLAWATDSALGLSLTQWACAINGAQFLLLFSVLAGGAAVAGLLAVLRAKRTLRRPDKSSPAGPEPGRFILLSGIVLNAGFLLAIAATAIPRLTIDPCI